MTDQPSITPPESAPHRGAQIALNLTVAGLIGGIKLNGGPGLRGNMIARDFGFGPFHGARLPQDRAVLRDKFMGRISDIRTARQQMQDDGSAILAALRAAPFGPAALGATLDQQARHIGDRLKFGSDMIRDLVVGLTPEARSAFADWLEQRMRRGPDAGGKDGGGKD